MSLEEKYRIPVEKLRWSYLHTGELIFANHPGMSLPCRASSVRIGP